MNSKYRFSRYNKSKKNPQKTIEKKYKQQILNKRRHSLLTRSSRRPSAPPLRRSCRRRTSRASPAWRSSPAVRRRTETALRLSSAPCASSTHPSAYAMAWSASRGSAPRAALGFAPRGLSAHCLSCPPQARSPRQGVRSRRAGLAVPRCYSRRYYRCLTFKLANIKGLG